MSATRIESNFDMEGWSLTAEEMSQVDKLDRKWRGCVPMLDGKVRDLMHPDFPFKAEFMDQMAN